MGAAWTRYAMCESALILLPLQTPIDCSEMKRGIRDKQLKTTLESRVESRIM
jgi:hypothetical protein